MTKKSDVSFSTALQSYLREGRFIKAARMLTMTFRVAYANRRNERIGRRNARLDTKVEKMYQDIQSDFPKK